MVENSDEQQAMGDEWEKAHGRKRSRERFVTVPQHRGCRARSPNAPFFGLFGDNLKVTR
jgi:hypothetical protein